MEQHPTLKINELKKQGIDITKPTTSSENKKRLLKLKFYFDNPSRNQKNKLGTFEVESPEHAIRVLAKFESEGATIRASFLNPNDQNLSKKMGIRFNYKSNLLYKYFND